MEFDNFDKSDFQEFNMGELPENYSEPLEQKALPYKINILPKLVSLFHTTFEPEVEVTVNIKEISFKTSL